MICSFEVLTSIKICTLLLKESLKRSLRWVPLSFGRFLLLTFLQSVVQHLAGQGGAQNGAGGGGGDGRGGGPGGRGGPGGGGGRGGRGGGRVGRGSATSRGSRTSAAVNSSTMISVSDSKDGMTLLSLIQTLCDVVLHYLDSKDTPAYRKPLSRQFGPSSSTNSTVVSSSRNVHPGLSAPPTTPIASSSRPISSCRKAGPFDSSSTISKPTSSITTSTTNDSKPADVQCMCKLPAVLKTVVRETSSKGRLFWRCSNHDGCSFFNWADEVVASDPRTPMVNVSAKRPYSTVSWSFVLIK